MKFSLRPGGEFRRWRIRLKCERIYTDEQGNLVAEMTITRRILRPPIDSGAQENLESEDN